MFKRPTQNRITAVIGGHARQIGKAAIVASAVAAASLTPVPSTAHDGGVGTGAAIGLGVLGGVLAGAAIASSAPPVYGAPPPPAAYYNPTPPYSGDYYSTPTYYPAPQYYFYGWTPYR
jgi:hypothetical protein